ncbi:MAG: glycoside hydrolase family 172 protein, partial [Bacteroidota bacterium]
MKQLIGILILLPLLLNSCNSISSRHNYPENSMEYPERAVTQRASSYDTDDWENGNADAKIIRAGEVQVLADLEGPGRITHIWFTSVGIERGYPRSSVLRMYWDGSEEPAVEAPLGDFFAAGHGLQVDVNSSRVANSSFGRANNCYWNMPFRESALVTLTNEAESEADSMGLYWYIDWEKRGVPEDVPYFHAQYRQENPVEPGKDYLIADIEGKGHYVGTVLSVRTSQPGWFGEGDDRFFVDEDTIPTLHGTGTEDYFNDAWGFRVLNRPNYGISIWEGMNTGSRITAYRWHVTDPVFFNKSLKFTIEHKGNTFYEDLSLVDPYTDRRPDFYSSVGFWYQQGKAKRFAEMPPVAERMAPFELIQVDDILTGKMPEHTAIQEMLQYTNGYGIHFTPIRMDETMSIPFEVTEAGDYLVFARVQPTDIAGIYDLCLDGVPMVQGKDLSMVLHQIIDIKLGNLHHLEKGTHTLKVVYRGTPGHDPGGNFQMDAIVLEPAGEFEK